MLEDRFCRRCTGTFNILRKAHKKTTSCPICPGTLLTPPFPTDYTPNVTRDRDTVDSVYFWPEHICIDYDINSFARRKQTLLRCNTCFSVINKAQRHHNEPQPQLHKDMVVHRHLFQPSLWKLQDL